MFTCIPLVPSTVKAWWGLRDYVVLALGGKWEVPATFSVKKKKRSETQQGNRIKMSLVQIGAFESIFCTPSPADVHNRPHSLEVKKPAEEQPTWSLIWPDIGKWFPMITSRSIWKLWVSLLVQQGIKPREGRHRSQMYSSKKQWWHYKPDLYAIWGNSLCVHICIKPHCFFVFNSFSVTLPTGQM